MKPEKNDVVRYNVRWPATGKVYGDRIYRVSGKQYGKMLLPFIQHEYVVLWKKREVALFVLLHDVAKAQQARVTGTWRSILRLVLKQLGGQARLDAIYDAVLRTAPDRIQQNPEHWKAAIRRTLQLSADFASRDRGVWGMA